MARWFVFLLVASIFLISIIQSAPVQEETSPANTLEDSIKKAMEKISKGFEDMMKDPKVNEFVKESQKMIENAAETIKTEAAKLIPKTDETAQGSS